MLLMIHLVYQRVANAADAPLSVAPQGGGVNPDKAVAVTLNSGNSQISNNFRGQRVTR